MTACRPGDRGLLPSAGETAAQRPGNAVGGPVDARSVDRFIQACVRRAAGVEIQAAALYGVYGQWCRTQSVGAVDNVAFRVRLARLGFDTRRGDHLFYSGIDWTAAGAALFDGRSRRQKRG